MKLCIDTIRSCLDSSIPPLLATCAPDGTPNVSYLSQMEYVDNNHVALTFQFFNKTRANVLAHPYATALISDSDTGAMYRLSLHYLRTETSGSLFERMKARLAGIASHTGMAGVFRLRGADVYRVLAIEAVPGNTIAPPPPRSNPLAALRAASQRMAGCTELGELLDETLAALDEELGLPHGMILMFDAGRGQLYTVASRGYAASGVGSEIPLHSGVIGVAAAQRVPIRIAYMTLDYCYGRAQRTSALEAGLASIQPEIPFPGLATPHSQIAVPIMAGDRLLGVLYADSMEDCRFGYQEEDVLVVLASQLGSSMQALQHSAEADDAAPAAAATNPPVSARRRLRVRRYTENDSVFVDDDYLIKGVAGAIFWKLVNDYAISGRTEFSNRELRLDPTLGLPDIDDNLEARLILLARRLRERCDAIAIEKTGRGRFRLRVERPLELGEAPPAQPGA